MHKRMSLRCMFLSPLACCLSCCCTHKPSSRSPIAGAPTHTERPSSFAYPQCPISNAVSSLAPPSSVALCSHSNHSRPRQRQAAFTEDRELYSQCPLPSHITPFINEPIQFQCSGRNGSAEQPGYYAVHGGPDFTAIARGIRRCFGRGCACSKAL